MRWRRRRADRGEHAGSTATAAPTATPTVATGPVAQGEGSADGGHFTFVITQLQRSGATVVLNATVTRAGDSPNDSIQIGSTFARDRRDVFDGVALIDPEGERKYLVAREDGGRCICSAKLVDVSADTVTVTVDGSRARARKVASEVRSEFGALAGRS